MDSKRWHTDQMNREVLVPVNPKRIISLVPSQTELLSYLGKQDELVGITKFCIYPESIFRSKTRVGGTKSINFERIEALQPDLIIGNKEENDREQILALAQKYPVWMSDILTFSDALDMIQAISRIIEKPAEGSQLVQEIRIKYEAFTKFNTKRPLKTAYFIWQNPFMVAGTKTFIHEMLQLTGFKNVYSHLERYPEIDLEKLKLNAPEIIFLSSEPFPFKDKHQSFFETQFPHAIVKLVDGTYFSWYGNRLLPAADYFSQLYEQTIKELKI